MSFGIGENAKSNYAKVWKVDVFDKYVKAQISTSEKDKDGNYVNSPWFATFVGSCVSKAKELERGNSIKVTAGKISVTKKDDKSYTNVVIFGFDLPDGEGQPSSSSRPVNSKRTQNLDVPPSREDDDFEDCPF